MNKSYTLVKIIQILFQNFILHKNNNPQVTGSDLLPFNPITLRLSKIIHSTRNFYLCPAEGKAPPAPWHLSHTS